MDAHARGLVADVDDQSTPWLGSGDHSKLAPLDFGVHIGEVIVVDLLNAMFPGMGRLMVCHEAGMGILSQYVQLLQWRGCSGSGREEVFG